MLTLQQMVDIAARFDTLIAHALIRACVVKALETGEPLVIPERARLTMDPPALGSAIGVVPAPDASGVPWRRWVERNCEVGRFRV